MPCPLLVVDVPPDVYNDFSSTDVHHNNMCHSTSTIEQPEQSSTFPGSSFSFSVTEQEPQSSSISGHAILRNMFLSRCVTGI